MLAVLAMWALTQGPSEKAAVLPFHVEGLAVNEVRRIDGVVRTRVRERGAEVLPDDATNAIVDSADALGLGCTLPETACAVKLGGIAAVDVVVAGAAVRVAEGVGVDVRIVDVKKSALRARRIALLPSEPDAQVEALRAVLASVYGESPSAALLLDVEPRVRQVIVDGFSLAIDELTIFAPGRHVLVVEAADHVPHRATLTLKDGVNPQSVKLAKIPKPPPPEPPTALEIATPFVLAGAGALVAAGGAIAGIVGSQSWFAFEQQSAAIRELRTTDPEYAAKAAAANEKAVDAANEWNNAGQYVVGVGAGAGALGVVAAAACAAWGVTVVSELPEESSAE